MNIRGAQTPGKPASSPPPSGTNLDGTGPFADNGEAAGVEDYFADRFSPR